MEKKEDKISALAEEVASHLGCEIYDLEILGKGRRKVLRVTIDREDGVTLDDCEAFSRDFGALLDVEDPIEGAYTLEISSPGLDRPLKRVKDFVKAVGRRARVVTKREIDGQSFIIGRIEAVEGNRIIIADENKEYEIQFEDISKARLEIEL